MYTHYDESSESLEVDCGKELSATMPHFNVISRACKVTVVGIECNGAAFLTSFQEGLHQE